MNSLSTTKMSSKGQVVIPEEIREQMGLHPGSQFIVLGEKDVVILKILTPPSIREFESLAEKVRREVRKAGLKKEDLQKAIKKARNK